MATDAEIGYGAILYRGDGQDPEVFMEIGEITGLGGAQATRDAQEATNMRSPNRFREYIAGLADPGELTFTVNYVPGNVSHEALREDFRLGRTVNWHIIWEQYAGQPQLNFQGFLTTFPVIPNAPVGDVITGDITIKITGYPEYEE